MSLSFTREPQLYQRRTATADTAGDRLHIPLPGRLPVGAQRVSHLPAQPSAWQRAGGGAILLPGRPGRALLRARSGGGLRGADRWSQEFQPFNLQYRNEGEPLKPFHVLGSFRE
jgi:hypothetical protein